MTPYFLQYTPNSINYTYYCQANFFANFFCRHTYLDTQWTHAYIHTYVMYVLDVGAGLLKLERRFR